MICIEHADMLDAIPRLVAEGIVCDACVTDPPYGLEFMGQEWDAPWRSGWQAGVSFSKPGIGERRIPWPSNAAASPFGNTNPTCATCGGRLRGARKCECQEPAWKPMRGRSDQAAPMRIYQDWCEAWAREVYTILRPGAFLVAFGGTRTYHRLASAIEDAGFVIQDCIMWLYGTGFPKRRDMLKPAVEPIVLAYKPGGKRTMQVDECRIAADGRPSIVGDYKETDSKVYEGRVNGDPSFMGGSKAVGVTDLGRWPANVCHDGSDEVMAAFPQSAGQQAAVKGTEPSNSARYIYNGLKGRHAPREPVGDTGSAARFFFSAKAGAEDRWGSRHPTVKPVELIRWLVRLTVPPGGLFIDPFAGSGTAAVAALAERRKAILIEREPQYVADIRERVAFYEGGGSHSVQAKHRNRNRDDGPLFAPRFDEAADAIASYHEAIRAIGERVKAGAPVPQCLLPAEREALPLFDKDNTP